MKHLIVVAASAIVMVIAAVPSAHAQTNTVTQVSSTAARPNLDVPYVPTPPEVVKEMLKMARVESTDYVIDLGSGDGRIVMAAVQQHGARGFGVDLNPDHIARSNATARRAGIGDRASFVNANLFDTDISKATVLTMYLLPDINLKLRSRLLDELKPGTRVVSHDFDMGEWKPDQQSEVESGRSHNVYYWVIPAKAAGTWTVATEPGSAPVQFMVNQKFQQIDGTARVGNDTAPLVEPRLNGDRISFILVSQDERGREVPLLFEGRIDGNAIDGTVTVNGAKDRAIKWRATKT
jgi:predicted O-methyltransferase YrrM